MAKRFYTADFHLGMSLLLDKNIMKDDVRPFKNVDKMNSALIRSCNQRAKVYTRTVPLLNNEGKQRYSYNCIFDENGNVMVDPANMKPVITKKPLVATTIIDKDLIIHVGDLACFKSDRDLKGIEINPQEFIQQIHANFINIRGNHDLNNKVKSACSCMQTNLGKRFPNVTIGHYPSYDQHAKETFKEGWIHLCGHVHKKWKHCLDVTHSVLNINVGVDVWNYQIISEEELVRYIESVLRMPKDHLNKVMIVDKKVVYV